MDKINIYHAFNGFLYAPVFLADELGFYPKNTELKFADGDKNAIELLCSHKDNGERNSFAICDPFSIDLNRVLEHTNDELCVVASLINVVPLWLFNPDINLKPVKNEADLVKYRSNITRLILYPEDTTGHLIGKRVQTVLGLQDHAVITKPFGQEFTEQIQNTDIVVTADVLRMVHYGLNENKIVFPYPMRAPQELQPFLFTAVLTLKSTVESNLWAVLGILGAIRTAIECLSVRNLEQKYVDALVKRFEESFAQLSITSIDDKRKLIRQAVSYLVDTEKIYLHYPKPQKKDDWTKAWDNARTEWKKQNPTKDYPTVSEKEEAIPALLVRPGWKSQLLDYFKSLYAPVATESTGLPPNIRKEFLTPFPKAVLIFGFLILVISALLLFRAGVYAFFRPILLPAGGEEHLSPWLFVVDSILFIGQVLSFLYLRKGILSLQKYDVELAWWGILVAIFAAFIFRVLEI